MSGDSSSSCRSMYWTAVGPANNNRWTISIPTPLSSAIRRCITYGQPSAGFASFEPSLSLWPSTRTFIEVLRLCQRLEQTRAREQLGHALELALPVEARLVENPFERDHRILGVGPAEQHWDATRAGGIEQVVGGPAPAREDEHVRFGLDCSKVLVRLVEPHDDCLRRKPQEVRLAGIRRDRRNDQVVRGRVAFARNEHLGV